MEILLVECWNGRQQKLVLHSGGDSPLFSRQRFDLNIGGLDRSDDFRHLNSTHSTVFKTAILHVADFASEL